MITDEDLLRELERPLTAEELAQNERRMKMIKEAMEMYSKTVEEVGPDALN